MSDADTDALRLDVWLWRVRAFKTRSLSMEYIKKRGVRVTRAGATRKVGKPGATICVGDIVAYGRRDDIRAMEILGLGERRGPPAEAQALYRLIEGDA